MHWIDWALLVLPLLICSLIGLTTRRYAKDVAGFMAGGRHAGRYLVCTARSEQAAGAAVFIAAFQAFLVSGFTLSWWQQLSVPASLLLMVTGYVVFRYRQTRALTLGEFFEKRYSLAFRRFAGVLGFVAGLLNFGIIPAVGARFMVAFLQLPQTVQPLSAFGVSLAVPTYLVLMAVFLTVCVVMTTSAGQISVLLTDCAEGMFSQIFYVFIAVMLLLFVFDWPTTKTVLLSRPEGQSLVNPFDSMGLKDFNIWFVLIGIFFMFYRTIAWQNQHAFNSSAATPHEARMGGVLGRWRAFASGVMVTLLSLCAITYFQTHSGVIDAELQKIADPATREQLKAPMALTMMLPVGAKGALLSICLMGIIAGDGMHLHSWSSIFVQDVLLPWRKKPLTPKQHLLWLRLAVVGVAVWAFFFGWLFPQTKFVQFWWFITEAIFVSGAGITLIGGLYWARGTSAGAWAAILIGAGLAVTGIGVQFYFERILGQRFVLTLPEISFFAAASALTSYVVISFLTSKTPHDMDRLLYRGIHAVKDDQDDDVPAIATKSHSWLYRILTFGIDRHFTRGDRWITIGITGWSMTWFVIFILGGVVNFIHPFSNEAWASYWLWTAVYLPLVIGLATTVWFTWGCSKDIGVFVRRLRHSSGSDFDPATVTSPTPLDALVAGTGPNTQKEPSSVAAVV